MSNRTSDPTNDQAASQNFPKLPTPGDPLNEPAFSLNEPASTLNEPASTLNEPASTLNEPASTLNDQQQAAIRMLVMGKTLSAAGEAVGVTRRTLYTWREDPDFQEELQRRREELWSDAAERLRAMVHASLDIFQEHLSDPYDRARFRAANAVLRISDLRRVVPPGKSERETP